MKTEEKPVQRCSFHWTHFVVLLAGLASASPARAGEADFAPEAEDAGLPVLHGKEFDRCWPDEATVTIRVRALRAASEEASRAKLEGQIQAGRERVEQCLASSKIQDAKQEAAAAARAQADREREAREKAEADHAQLVAQRRSDPNWLAPALSAEACAYALERQRAEGDIAKEKKYGRIGGVVDKHALYNDEQRIRQADDEQRKIAATMRKGHLKQTACSDKAIAKLAPCMPVYVTLDGSPLLVNRDESCNEPHIRAFAELLEQDD